MLAWFVEPIAIKMTLIEIDVATVLESTAGSSGEHEWEVGITVAVSISHSAAEQGHGSVQQRPTVQVGGLGQSGQEITELLNAERIALSQFLHMSGITIVMAEFVPRL